MHLDGLITYLTTHGLDFLLRGAGAVAMWFVGRYAIGLACRLVDRGMQRGAKLDATLIRYLLSIIRALLTAGLAMGIIGYLGVETTSFAALLAGAGLAIGTAWGGLLQHFAAGAFLQLLRPFKVGDYVVAGGVEGTVTEVGLFGTTILTPDNVATTIGNNKVFGETIKNYSVEPHRRVDCVAKIAHTVNPSEAIALLRPIVEKIPNVVATPEPVIDVLELTAEGPKLCVRPSCHTQHYWQVWFDTNRAIVDAFGKAGYPTPASPIATRAVST